MADPVRRALSIAVGSFEDPDLDLAYADDFAGRLREALTGLGYECLDPPGTPSSASIDAAIQDALGMSGPDDILLIHLITHAERAPASRGLYVIGSDARLVTPLEEWVRSVEDRPGPLTLFLLDVCFAGEAARLSWQGDLADGSARAWVIGAAAPEQAAYDGWLTRAVVNVIGALRRGELDLDATLRDAPFVTVARAIGQEVKRLVEEADAFAQQATGSLLDITAIPPELPFFPNPAPHAPSAAQRARAEVDVAIRPFLDDVDEALDASHFFERAAGGPRVTTGCFSGRGRELRDLVPWMQGYGEGPLRVVTGSPGAGKSALLGVMVCAAHPRLRAATATVWEHVERAPLPIKRLAAVHARKRGPGEIAASLGRQLGLAPERLVEGVTTLDEIPVVVLDALDEAELPASVMNALLLPLAGAVRTDGTPAVRLLVGTRRWGFEPLLDRARDAGGLIDLDEVDRDVLFGELDTYVQELLRANPVYRDRGDVRGAFAAKIARSLSAPRHPDEERWGEFLVAGLYSRRFLSGPEVTDPAKAADLGARVPRTLPEVFALDLADGSKGAEARSLLAVLAHAQGEGMPLALAVRAATALGEASLDLADRDRWDAARFYLRSATDVDGTMIYRIFHEGLAEHLRMTVPAAPAIYEALVSPLDDPRGHRWDLAEPYLLRHAPEHAHAAGLAEDLAGDVEYLIQCEPAALAAIAAVVPSRAGLVRELLGGAGTAPEQRRRALTMAAVRAGDAELAGRLAVAPSGTPLPWRPVWMIGNTAQTSAPDGIRLLGRLEGHVGAANAVAVAVLGENTAAISGGEDGTVRLWDLSRLTQLSLIQQEGPVSGLGIGRDASGPLVLLSDEEGTLKGGNLAGSDYPPVAMRGKVTAVAVGEMDGEFAAVTGTSSGAIRHWTFSGGKFRSHKITHPGSVECIALGHRPDGTAFAVAGGANGAIVIHELRARSSRRLPTPFLNRVEAVATGVLDGRSIIVAAGGGSPLLLWDETTGHHLGTLDGPVGPVRAAAIGETGGRTIAVTGSFDGTVCFWDLRTRSELARRRDGGSAVRSVAFGRLAGEPVALAGTGDGSVFVWNIGAADSPGLIGGARTDGTPVALVRERSGTLTLVALGTGDAAGSISPNDRPAVVGVRRTVIADREFPLLRFSDGSQALWAPSRGFIDVDAWLDAAHLWPESTRTATVVRDGALVEFGVYENVVFYRPPGSWERHIVEEHGDRVTAMAASRLADRTVLYTAAGRTVRVWDVETLRELDTIEVGGEILTIAVDPAGYLVVGTDAEVICFAHASARTEWPR